MKPIGLRGAWRVGWPGEPDRRAPRQPGVAEGRHPRPPHLARRQRRHPLEDGFRRRLVEAPPPVVLGAQRAVHPHRDRARGVGVGRLHGVDVHPVQDRPGDGALVVRGRDPDHLAGVDRDLGELVGEGHRGVVLEQAVERAERVVGVLAARLVDLVDDHHRIRVLAVDQGLEDLPPARAPSTGWTGGLDSTQPAVSELHRDEAEAGGRAAARSRARSGSCRCRAALQQQHRCGSRARRGCPGRARAGAGCRRARRRSSAGCRRGAPSPAGRRA